MERCSALPPVAPRSTQKRYVLAAMAPMTEGVKPAQPRSVLVKGTAPPVPLGTVEEGACAPTAPMEAGQYEEEE
jgi:hypothetical protein